MSVTHVPTPREDFESLTNHKPSSITTLEELAHETSNDLKLLQNKKHVQKQVLTAMSLAYLDQQTEEKLLQKISEFDTKSDLLSFYDGPDEQLAIDVNVLESNWKVLDRQMNVKHEDLKTLADDVSRRYRQFEERKTQVNTLIEEGEQLEREFEQLINEDNEDKELLESALKVKSFDTDPSKLNSQARTDVDGDLKRVSEQINAKETDTNNERSNIESLKTQLEIKQQQLQHLPVDDSKDDPVKKFYYFLKKLNELLDLLK